MNVIEALYISLGLDTREYQKKEKEVTTSLKKFGETSAKQTKLIAESGKKAAGAFSLLKVEVLGALAAFGMGAGFKSFIESSMKMQVAAGRQAAALGVSVNSLQVWKQMAVNMGESGDAAVTTLQKVAQGMAAARRGDMSFINAANQYGADIKINDNTETVMSKLNKMAYAIKQKYGTQQAMSLLGEVVTGDLGQQTLLMKSQADLAAFRADAAKHAIQLTPQEIAQNAKLLQQWGDLLGDFDKIKVKLENKLLPVVIKLGKEFENWVDSVDWDKVIADIGSFIDKVQALIGALGGVKGILIEIAAIKVFGWALSIASTILKLRALTTALLAARVAAAGGAAAGAAEGAAAAGGAGLASKIIPLATRVSMWALPVWALFHSESTGGKQRADGTYEDEPDVNDPKNKAAYERYMANQKADQQTRGIRNNNPGNIKYGAFARSMGATGADSGGFAIFPNAAAGIDAIRKNLASYGRKGFDTPSEIAHRWSTTDQAAYTKRLASLFGGNPNQKLDMTDPKVLAALSGGIITQENGFNPYASLARGSAYVGAPRGQSGTSSKPSTTTSNVSIGTMNVNAPKATNANGIAMDVRKAFRDNPLISGSVTALA